MIVKNMTSSNGNKVANQFLITDGNTEVFQSYDTIIAKHDEYGFTVSSKYNYSNTTSKYFNKWLGEWGFNRLEIDLIRKWLKNTSDGGILVEVLSRRVNIKYVDELQWKLRA